MEPFTTNAYIYSLNKGKMLSSEINEMTILEERNDSIKGKYYIADYKGIKCTAIYNCFTCCYYADDVYGRIENYG